MDPKCNARCECWALVVHGYNEYRVLVDTLKRANGEGRVLGDRGGMGRIPPPKKTSQCVHHRNVL